MIIFEQDQQDWYRFDSVEEFREQYPKPVYGKYIPQPNFEPEKYPCFAKEVDFKYVSNGPDEYVMAYIYDFQEINL